MKFTFLKAAVSILSTLSLLFMVGISLLVGSASAVSGVSLYPLKSKSAPEATLTATPTSITTITATGTPTQGPPGCDSYINIVDSPNAGPAPSSFSSVAVLSSSDIWAVGTYQEGGGFNPRAFTEHWDGGRWNLVSTPPLPGADLVYLQGVATISSSDVWAVGYYEDSTLMIRALTIHWDGAQWNIIPVNGTGTHGFLYDVTSIASNDVWAIGKNSSDGPLGLRWDGAQWNSYFLPGSQAPGNSSIYAVSASASNDVWAVGSTVNPSGEADTTLIDHWDGSQWRMVSSPNQSNSDNYLGGIVAASPTDAWAVGYSQTSTSSAQTLIQHWDGTAWSTIPSPSPNGARNIRLNDVTYVSTGDVWAVGSYSEDPSGVDPHALIEHWDGTTWSSTPVTPNSIAYLVGTAAVTANDVWAVGGGSAGNGGLLTEHWDGAQWSVVPSVGVGLGSNHLADVTVITANNIWAVGSTSGHTLTEHWDGSTWSVVPSPSDGLGYADLIGVAAVSANDVWAVGSGGANGTPLTEHWDGGQWSVIPAPISAGETSVVLRDVAAVSANDVWAVGNQYMASTGTQTLIEHWDGAQWSIISSPNPNGSSDTELNGVAATGVSDVWAVGFAYIGGKRQTLTAHWDGANWNVVTSPNPGGSQWNNYLYGVAGSSTGDVWAVGSTTGTGSYIYIKTIALHWDGTSWNVVPNTDGNGTTNNSFRSVSVTGPNDVFAVGEFTMAPAGIERHTLVEHWDGTHWSIVSSPDGQRARNSDLISVGSVSGADVWTVGYQETSTATLTLVERYTDGFSDALRGTTFYPYIKCLACSGIISGYSDNTFRPGNDVTRGQLSKIVSNAAGFNDDPGPQRFEDVLPENTFYPWIQRLAGRGFIGGYTCGGVGEPCGVNNLPYFRPNANATRGQLAKIVSNAAGFNDPPNGQTFADVPPDDAFYPWIQRLASRGVMSGYPCGGPGEPCDDQQRPYFRPQRNVTRGQTSKIVAGAFLPDCPLLAKH